MTEMSEDKLGCTAEIVAAYVRHHTLETSELPGLISSVFAGLNAAGQVDEAKPAARAEPAVPIRKSVTDNFIVCLEDGRKLKMLKKYLRIRYNLSPEEYRRRWGLPGDYPMVAPAYAERRSEIARQLGLGRKPAAQPDPILPAPEQPKRRAAGRRRAA